MKPKQKTPKAVKAWTAYDNRGISLFYMFPTRRAVVEDIKALDFNGKPVQVLITPIAKRRAKK